MTMFDAGDPNWAWTLTAVYLAAAGLALAAGVALGRIASGRWWVGNRGFWFASAAVLCTLAAVRRVELHVGLKSLADDIARDLGFYDSRREVWSAAVAGIAMLGLAGIAAIALLLRRSSRGYWVAVGGFAVLLGYGVLRANAQQKVSYFPDLPLSPLSQNDAAIELVGVTLFVAAAIWALRLARRRGGTSIAQ